jgi:hypothetical protein
VKQSDQPYLTLSKIANKLNVVYPKLKYYNKYYCGKCGALESECKCGCEKVNENTSTKMQLYYYGVLDSNEKADFILNIYELYIYSKAKVKCSFRNNKIISLELNNGKVKKCLRYKYSAMGYYYQDPCFNYNSTFENRIYHDKIDEIVRYTDIISVLNMPKQLSMSEEELLGVCKYLNLRSLLQYNEMVKAKDTYIETMEKLKRYDLLAYIFKYPSDKDVAWELMRKNKTIPANFNLYHDYVLCLKSLKKDIKNEYYIASENFVEMNKKMNKAYNKHKAELELEKNKLEYESKYKDKVAKLLNKDFGNDKFHITVLKNIQDFYEEGNHMCHCVYRMGYFKQENSYIFSIRDRFNKRLETAEIKNHEINQLYGYGDKPSEYHEEIKQLLLTKIDNIYKCLNA